MNKILYILFFLFLSFIYFSTTVYLDYSNPFYALIIAGALIIGFIYFNLLCSALPFFNKFISKMDGFSSQGGVKLVIPITLNMAFYAAFSLSSGEIKNYLLKKDHVETYAFISGNYTSKGTPYAIYGYRVDRKNYEFKFENGEKKYKDGDSVRIIYYGKNPVISRLK